jgi:hypothetical protein
MLSYLKKVFKIDEVVKEDVLAKEVEVSNITFIDFSKEPPLKESTLESLHTLDIHLSQAERERMICEILAAKSFKGDQPMWNYQREDLEEKTNRQLKKIYTDTSLDDIGWGY